MKKIKFGRNLLLIMLGSFVLQTIVSASNLETSNPELFENVGLLLVGAMACSGVILWFWSFADFYDNYKSFEKPTLLFLFLLLFNWVAAITYYFTVICKREKANA